LERSLRFAWSEVCGSLGAKFTVRLEQSLRFAWSNELALVSAFRRATSGRTRGQTRLAWFKWLKRPQTESPCILKIFVCARDFSCKPVVKSILASVMNVLARQERTRHPAPAMRLSPTARPPTCRAALPIPLIPSRRYDIMTPPRRKYQPSEGKIHFSRETLVALAGYASCPRAHQVWSFFARNTAISSFL